MLIWTRITVTALLFLGYDVLSAPVTPDLSNESQDRLLNETSSSDFSSMESNKLEDESDSITDKQPTARMCTLKALDIILYDRGAKLEEECRQVLKRITENAVGKGKESTISEEIDLREELKSLAERRDQYDAMSDEIQNAENLLAEKEFPEEPAKDSMRSKQQDLKQEHYVRDGDRAPLIRLNQDLVHSNELQPQLKQKSFKKQAKEDFRDGHITDSSNFDFKIPEQENYNDDYLVIPLRYLRKQSLFDGKQDIESLKPRRANIDPKIAAKTKWYDENEAAQWLLQAILSMESGRDAEQQFDLFGSGTAGAKSKNLNRAMPPKEVRIIEEKNTDLPREENNIQNGDDELDGSILSEVENDIIKLGKDLRRLKFQNI